jgi:DNA mismatch endonuclease (patch repair protein)
MPRRTIDIAFTRSRVAVFVDGCFWHRCPVHGSATISNSGWWADKLQRNVERDEETNARLVQEGWLVIRVWEHEDPHVAARVIAAVVESRRPQAGAPS